MHYIRFLKYPTCRLLPNQSYGYQLSSKITITSDLGESFLCADIDLVAVLLEDDDRFSEQNHKIFSWKAGMRELEISWVVTSSTQGQVSRLKWPCRLMVYPSRKELSPKSLLDVLEVSIAGDGLRGGVMKVESLKFTPQSSSDVRRVKRCLDLDSGDQMVVYEDTGNSIARHIWDAGLVLSSYLYGMQAGFDKTKPKEMPLLKKILDKPLSRIIELGAGCGIVGITLATLYLGAEVIMTDLDEAEELAKYNISKNVIGCQNFDRALTVAYQNLDWVEALDHIVINAKWDLVVAADVTYNSESAPDLVNTMAECVKYNKDAAILVAMKVRHDSEAVFFDLMKEKRLHIVDTVVLPLPVLGEEDQEINVYLFHRNALAK